MALRPCLYYKEKISKKKWVDTKAKKRCKPNVSWLFLWILSIQLIMQRYIKIEQGLWNGAMADI